jgi:hypothetical protein
MFNIRSIGCVIAIIIEPLLIENENIVNIRKTISDMLNILFNTIRCKSIFLIRYLTVKNNIIDIMQLMIGVELQTFFGQRVKQHLIN